MAARLIIEGNAVYEIDEECVEYQRKYGRAGDGKNNPEDPQLGGNKEPEV